MIQSVLWDYIYDGMKSLEQIGVFAAAVACRLLSTCLASHRHPCKRRFAGEKLCKYPPFFQYYITHNITALHKATNFACE